MARKSRKATNNAVVTVAETKYKTAIYVRLSYEDERKIEQESVDNQKAFLMDYVTKNDDLTLVATYIDRGVTGTKFDRPEFNKMISDMRAGKINCIVVKDLSRLGRNYLESGDYIEKIFPFFGVRFIAVTDNYDSLTAEPTEDGLIVPLKNLINEVYAKDISRKIRSSIDNMYRNGVMVASSIAYGYIKDPDGDHQIMIDEVAAPVVRRIFDEYISGKSVISITKGLNEDEISSPSERRIETGARKKRKYGKVRWVGKTITYILTNSIYTGDLEMGKRKTDLCKGLKNETQSKEDRYIVKDHHEAIISHETFEKAQHIYESRKSEAINNATDTCVKKNAREAILAGVLYCGDCKRKMTIHRYTRKKKAGVCYKAYYVCGRSPYYGDVDPFKNFNADVAEETVAELIRAHIRLYTDAYDRLNKTNKKSLAAKNRRDIEKKVEALVARKEKIGEILQGLYSDYSDGVFSESEYMNVKKSYVNEVVEIETHMEELAAEEQSWIPGYEGDSDMSESFRKYAGFEKLTNEIVRTFIKSIYYYADDRMEVEYVFADELAEFADLVEGRESA